MSRVPSLESLSTTRTSLTCVHGMSSSTRPIDCASLYVGMTTETRNFGSSPDGHLGEPRGKGGIHREAASGGAEEEAQRDRHRHKQLPDPGRPPLREPEAREEAEGAERDWAREDSQQQADAEGELGRSLNRRRDARVARH